MATPELDIEKELAALRSMTTTELCERYAALHGQPARTRHKPYLIRKIAWRIQALAEGDLSERARRRASELANDADVRVMPPKAPDYGAVARIRQQFEDAGLGDPELSPRIQASGHRATSRHRSHGWPKLNA